MNYADLNTDRLRDLMANYPLCDHHLGRKALEPHEPNPLNSDEEMETLVSELVALSLQGVDSVYFDILTRDEVLTHIESNFKSFVLQAKVIVPHPVHIFAAFHHCPNPRVMIFGQDPYPQIDNGVCRATGHSFDMSNTPNTVSQSMKMVFKSLEQNIEGFVAPGTVNLLSWKEQGVLLLNTSFTTIAGVSGAHKRLWSKVTEHLVAGLCNAFSDLVVIRWGAHAKGIRVTNTSNIIDGIHPVGGRSGCKESFLDIDYFGTCNACLEFSDRKPIEWCSICEGYVMKSVSTKSAKK